MMFRYALSVAMLLMPWTVATTDEPATHRVLEAPAQTPDVTEEQLFAMCCWARGRSGFQHCVEYGFCVDNPGKICVGRGASEGRRMRCESPPVE